MPFANHKHVRKIGASEKHAMKQRAAKRNTQVGRVKLKYGRTKL